MSLLDDASLLVTPNAEKAGKLYSIIPTNGNGDFSVTRATTATRTNSSGLIESTPINEPRLDYSLGSCPNILLEPQRTNLCLWSEQFDNASWLQFFQASVTPNTTTSPSGVQNADTLTANGILASHFIASNSISLTSGVSYSVSIYVKKNTNNFIQINTSGATGGQFANFDVNNGVVGSVGTISGSTPTSSIASVGNGWHRCTMVFTASASASTTINPVLVSSASSARAESNTLSTSVFLWGAQYEAGAYPTSYIPTSSASVTRNADVVQATGVSSLIGQTEGTIFIDLNFTNVGVEKYILILRDTASTNFISLRRLATGEIRFVLAATTSSGTTNQSSAVLANGNYKIAYKYISGSIKIFINGVLLFTLTPTFTFGTALSIIDLGHQNSLAQLNDRINSMALFPTPLTDGEMSMLTSGIYTPALAYAQLGLVSESPACLDSSVNALL